MKITWLSVIKKLIIEEVEKPHKELPPAATLTAMGVLQMRFPGQQSWSCGLTEEERADPNMDVCLSFQAGTGFKAAGYLPRREYYVIDDLLYCRLTWSDFGVVFGNTRSGRRESGMKVVRDKKLIYYVKEIEWCDELRITIADKL